MPSMKLPREKPATAPAGATSFTAQILVTPFAQERARTTVIRDEGRVVAPNMRVMSADEYRGLSNHRSAYRAQFYGANTSKQYKQVLGLIIKQAAKDAGWVFAKNVPIAMQQTFVVDTQTLTAKPDIDNLVKILFDAIEKIIYRNDSQVVRSTEDKINLAGPPRILLHVRIVSEAELEQRRRELLQDEPQRVFSDHLVPERS